MNDRIDSSRLYARIAQDIARNIASGQFQVGQRLPAERELAQTYNVSRPSIREAVIALEVDGLVEVRMGSGVYVTAKRPRGGKSAVTDFGPFEILEARRAIEGETCAMAAAHITEEELRELDRLVTEMQTENVRDIVRAEDADRRFHLVIANATRNSAMPMHVQLLWEARARSPQYRLLADKAHAAGLRPRADEHNAIIDALRSRDPDASRQAMRDHLTRVIESLLEATETLELEEARARIAEQRRRYVGEA